MLPSAPPPCAVAAVPPPPHHHALLQLRFKAFEHKVSHEPPLPPHFIHSLPTSYTPCGRRVTVFTIFRHYIGSCSKRLRKKSFRTLAIEIARKFSPHVLERLRDTALAASMNVDCCNEGVCEPVLAFCGLCHTLCRCGTKRSRGLS